MEIRTLSDKLPKLCSVKAGLGGHICVRIPIVPTAVVIFEVRWTRIDLADRDLVSSGKRHFGSTSLRYIYTESPC
jgi:hypothetical protein